MDTKINVESIMTRKVATLLEEENLRQVREKLMGHAFNHLPVVDSGKVVGMLSQRDLLRHTVAGVDESLVARSREARYLEETFVRDVMRTQVLTIGPTQSIKEAAQLMLRHRIGALPVTSADQTLLGIITENDIVRLYAEAL